MYHFLKIYLITYSNVILYFIGEASKYELLKLALGVITKSSETKMNLIKHMG